MTTLLRRIALLETARQRHDAPAGPGLAALLAWAQRGHPTAQWWTELTELVATSPYRDQFEAQTGLGLLLEEAQRFPEGRPR